MELTLKWSTCKGDPEPIPCRLYKLRLERLENRAGVYIIWYEDDDGGYSDVLDVGQGIFKDRLAAHKDEPDIEEKTTGLWELQGDVLVTFAEVQKKHRDGVESYLADAFELRGGVKRYPQDDPIRVNLPYFLPEQG